jgi:predicted O-methyltransferase YrrM
MRFTRRLIAFTLLSFRAGAALGNDCATVPGEFSPPTGAQAQSHMRMVLKELIRRQKGSSDTWGFYHSHIVKLISSYFSKQARPVWVEIGTAFGQQTAHVLEKMPGVTAHAVDPCEAAYDPTDATARRLDSWRLEHSMSRRNFSNAWASALVEDQRQWPCRYHLHKKRSTQAAADFADGSIDVLFVDGLHTFDGVMADLEAYWPKLKPLSLLIMNDYKPHPRCGCKSKANCDCSFPGVRQAACKFLKRKGLHQSIIEEGAAGLTNAVVVIGMPSSGANAYACADLQR